MPSCVNRNCNVHLACYDVVRVETEMAIDPYKTLGVDKTASQDEIQKAYRKLAKKIHPDLNPGNKKAEEQFKEIASAYTLLSDEAKRKQFDAGEIDGLGAENRAAGV